jgi:HAE1 family hydrophobic/amphiphilic exporter-1
MVEEKNSYLDNLTFDENLKKKPIAWYLGNIRIVLLVLLVVLGLGLYSFFSLPRELNPSIDISIITVTTALPGASPEDVESLVSKPLEDKIKSVDDIESLTSTSRSGVSNIVVEFQSGVEPDKAKQDVQSAVDTVSDLPDDATEPSVNKIDFEDQPVWTFSLSAGEDIPGLNRFAQRLENRLEEESIIDKVEISGKLQREIQIIVKPEVVREKRINPQQLSGTVKSALSSYPAGDLNTGSSSFALTIDPGIEDINDIRDTKLNLQGEVYKIEDIASVIEISSPGQAKAFESSPKKEASPIVTFSVYKVSEATIDKASKKAHKIVEEQTKDFDHVNYTTVIDYADEISEQFNSLGKNFAQTILLVFLVMFVFLGIREAFLSSLSIPLAVLISFFVMFSTDITLNFISLFSLLLALGLLVDNAIVVVSAVNSYYKTGKFTAYETGLLVFKDFFIPLISTNITTVWAFLPLILATGIMGEFIEPIPIIVSTTIIASAFVGFFLTLPIALLVLAPNIARRVKMMFAIVLGLLFFVGIVLLTQPIFNKIANIDVLPQWLSGILVVVLAIVLLVAVIMFVYILPKIFSFLKDKTKKTVNENGKALGGMNKVRHFFNHGIVSFRGLSTRYKKYLYSILSSRGSQWKVIAIIVIFFVISYLMPVLGFVENVFFPSEDTDILYISAELPSGTNIETSEIEAKRLANKFRKTEELLFLTSEIGAPAPNSGAPSGNNLILLTLKLTPTESRDITSMDLAEKLRKKYEGDYAKGKLSIVELSGGPPAGSDIQIKYLGPDLDKLDSYAKKTQEYLSQRDNIANITQSINAGTSKISFVPDEKKLADYGLSESDLGLWLRSFATGFTVDNLEVGDEEYDIVFRLSSSKETPDDLNAVTVPTSRGNIPLQALGKTVLKTNPTVITREDGKRTISVSASVTEGGNTGAIGQELENWADTELGLDTGYTWQTGGVNEENQKSLNSIFQAMLLSAVLILVTLVIQLGSFRKALIVMLVIPLAVSGVLILFAVFAPLGITLSFPAMIGMLALFGIVVNNSILIVEKINQNLAANFELKESIADACSSRLEPIFLTTMTTIIGLIPITLSSEVWRDLGGAIICGLTFSGILMLFFIPTVYWMWMAEGKDKKTK